MIYAHLRKHWLARRGEAGLVSWSVCIVRSLRVLLFLPDHRAMVQLGVVRDYLAKAAGDDLFHHLSHREYLVRGLSLRQRVECVLTHYRFEEVTFNHAYKHAVYLAGGLPLWRHAANGSNFVIQLEMASRLNAEGDLLIAFIADGKCLHRLGFSWVSGNFAGVAAPLLPFVARNQGKWTDSGQAFAAFEEAFPNNSPGFFCFAALQGVAHALGMGQVVAINSAAHIASTTSPPRDLSNAYDGFWKILGGVELSRSSYLIALPFYLKPLSDMPSKHRKRAALRREYWRAIGASAGDTVRRHLHRPVPQHEAEVALHEPA